MSRHTPEPWRLTPDFDVLDPSGQSIVLSYEVGTENARRIVACVNACQGIPTEALNRGLLAEALTLLERTGDGLHSWKERNPPICFCPEGLPCHCPPRRQEEHLADCAACERKRHRLDVLRTLGRGPP